MSFERRNDELRCASDLRDACFRFVEAYDLYMRQLATPGTTPQHAAALKVDHARQGVENELRRVAGAEKEADRDAFSRRAGEIASEAAERRRRAKHGH